MSIEREIILNGFLVAAVEQIKAQVNTYEPHKMNKPVEQILKTFALQVLEYNFTKEDFQ